MTYQDKVELIRTNIITNVQIYKNTLAGRYYLYIFDNMCFEMYFGIENYMHLTGVGCKLSPNQFYSLAKDGFLNQNQLFFSPRFPLKTALEKTSNLQYLADFIHEGYIIIKDLKTDTAFYPYAITNLDLSLLIGLKSESTDNIYIPKSFRVKGKTFDKADNKNLFFINFIIAKTDHEGLYHNVLYHDDTLLSSLDPEILAKIDLPAVKLALPDM